MSIKSNLVAVIGLAGVALCSSSISSHAAITTYTFSGQADSNSYYEGVQLFALNIADVLGKPVTGTISFDSSVSGVDAGTNYEFYSPVTISGAIGSHQFFNTSNMNTLPSQVLSTSSSQQEAASVATTIFRVATSRL